MMTIAQLCEQRQSEYLNLARLSKCGLDWCFAYSGWLDGVIRDLFSIASKGNSVRGIGILATGGYGRRELAPWSDIDLALVVSEDQLSENDRLVRETYTVMFDTIQAGLGLKLGYAYHLVGDTSGLDGKSRTGLLDLRLIAGDPTVVQEFQQELQSTFAPGAFLIEKMAERQRSIQETHDTPLVVEPNLKEGRGGLRDFHSANWIRHAAGVQSIRPNGAYETVIAYRNALHAVSGKPNDRWTRAKQAEVADAWSSDPFSMGSELAGAMLQLAQCYQDAVDVLQEVRFDVSPGVYALRGEARFSREATMSEFATGLAQATQLGLRIVSQPAPTQSGLADPSILESLQGGEPALRSLDESGILDVMLPELTRCRTLMPRDSSHTYTVFEHTLRLVAFLRSDAMPHWLADVRDSLDHWELLVLAAALHDVGKWDPSGPHEVTGAAMARQVSERWRLAKADSEMVVWLVENHLAMDRLIRFRDVYDPAIGQQFAEFVGSKARLDALSLLTWADVHAVAPSMWTPSQDEALRVLYGAAANLLEQPTLAAPDAVKLRKRLTIELKNEQVPDADLNQFLDSLSTAYVVATPPDMVRLNFHYFRKALLGETTLEFNHRPELRLSELTVCTPDQPGLLSMLMGVIYARDLNLQAVRVHTTQTSPAVALDQFTLDHVSGSLPEATCRQLSQTMLAVIEGTQNLEDIFSETGKDFHRQQENVSIQWVEGAGSMLEIRAPSGRGLGFRVARWITDQGWIISDAKIGQWAGRGAATFRITLPDRSPVSRASLEAALAARV